MNQSIQVYDGDGSPPPLIQRWYFSLKKIHGICWELYEPNEDTRAMIEALHLEQVVNVWLNDVHYGGIFIMAKRIEYDGIGSNGQEYRCLATVWKSERVPV